MQTLPPSLVLTGLTLLIVIFAWLSLAAARARDGGAVTGMGQGTRFFLVLLRLAIGWHFLVEGLDKLQSPTWSSEGYLREASGPLAPKFRELAGDSVRERLTPGPALPAALSLSAAHAVGLLSAASPAQPVWLVTAPVLAGSVPGALPEPLEIDWQAYLHQFTHHYHLSPDQAQRAQNSLLIARGNTLFWLQGNRKEVQKPSTQPPPLKLPMTLAQRLRECQACEDRARLIEKQDLLHYGSEAWERLRLAKADANRLRADLRKDLDAQTAQLKKGLESILTRDQREQVPPRFPPRKPLDKWTLLDWSDHLVKYGLAAIGLCLLLGVLTRLACVGGALMLLSFFLAMPPLPGWPENPRAEGHYLYLNKNIIEMLALLALATTRSGRWLGLDGLLRYFRPRRKKSSPPATAAKAPATVAPPPAGALAKEKDHGS